MIGQPLSQLKQRNAMLWSADVGRMHSRNNILIKGDRVFLSTSGEHWNKPDDRDGVHCIDLNTGTRIWFAHTLSDANEIALVGNTLLVGTDSGRGFAIDCYTGKILAHIDLGCPIFARAVELENGKTAAMISHSGDVCLFSCKDNTFSIIGNIPHLISANVASINANSFLVGTEGGLVIAVDVLNREVKWRSAFQVEPHKSTGHGFTLQIRGISNIAIEGDRAILSYVRSTYDRRPPIVCFSLRTGKKLWDAGRVQSASKIDRQDFGNARVTPVIWNGLVITTFSYNESVHAFSLQSGKWMWRLLLDDAFFQNWASPVLDGTLMYVPRINGVLSIVDLKIKKILSSYSVEIFNLKYEDRPAADLSREEAWPSSLRTLESSGPYPGQEIVAGICSTPAILDDKILVGTVSGRLCCFRKSQSRE